MATVEAYGGVSMKPAEPKPCGAEWREFAKKVGLTVVSMKPAEPKPCGMVATSDKFARGG